MGNLGGVDLLVDHLLELLAQFPFNLTAELGHKLALAIPFEQRSNTFESQLDVSFVETFLAQLVHLARGRITPFTDLRREDIQARSGLDKNIKSLVMVIALARNPARSHHVLLA